MPEEEPMDVLYSSDPGWNNYNHTRSFAVAQQGRFVHVPASGTGGIAELTARPAALLRGHLQRALATQAELAAQQQPGRVWAMPVGAGWSFNSLTGSPILQLLCAGEQLDDAGNVFDRDGLVGMAMVGANDFEAGAQPAEGAVAMLLGGTRLRQLLDWCEPQNFSIRTSGTQLGGSIAGLIATATHGSRLGYGGVQNQVAGMLLVTGPQRSVWIEPASQPVLSNEAARALDPGVEVEIVRDDARFADALVHIGCMGMVCAVAVRLDPLSLYRVIRKRHDITMDWLDRAGHSKFEALAAELGGTAPPCFYEMTLDPAGPRDDGTIRAFHTFYFEVGAAPTPVDTAKCARAPGMFGMALHDYAGKLKAAPEATSGGIIDQFNGADYFEHVLFHPDQPPPDEVHTWGQLHGGGISGNVPGALCNGSFAIARTGLARAIRRMFEAVVPLKKHFIFTVRFVSDATGTMAFTHFGDNAVIEIDGLSRLGYDTIFQGQRDVDRYPVQTELALAHVRAAFDHPGHARIDYAMHWGKLGWSGDEAKAEAVYGPSTDPASPLARWRETRRALVDPTCIGFFANQEALDWGLVD